MSDTRLDNGDITQKSDGSQREQPHRRRFSRRGVIAGALAIGAVAGYWLVARQSRSHRMPNEDLWCGLLSDSRGAHDATRIMGLARDWYDALVPERPPAPRRALDFHQTQFILPALALYQALVDEHGDREQAIAETDAVLTAQAERSPLRRTMPVLARIPSPIGIVAAINRVVMRLGFPSPGFEVTFVDEGDTITGFDVHRCFYLDTLTHYGVPELTPVFCKMDDVIYGQHKQGLVFERSGTLGRGDSRCDFRWRRVAADSGT